MERYPEHQYILNQVRSQDATAHEYLDEEINIVLHKLKFIPTESRPKVLLIDDARVLSQDYPDIVRESVGIAGGIWIDTDDIISADKIIFTQNSPQLYGDIPTLLEIDLFKLSPAVQNNEIYIIEYEYFGQHDEQYILSNIEILAEIIQPKYFIYGHHGEDWVQFDIA